MESPLDALRRSLEAGDLEGARSAAESLRRSQSGSTQIAAEVLHELRQPLLGIKAYAQMVAEEVPSSGGPIQLMLAQIERMEQIISDFLRISSDKPAPKQPTDLVHAVRSAERLFHLNRESARIRLEVDAPSPMEVEGNPRLLEQLVLNLLNNARDAMNGLGRLKVQVTREASAPVLYVADWGPGIPPELRERIFEPYVTSKSRGSGLGLAVCRRIAAEHKAVLSLAPSTALGDQPPPATVFKVAFSSNAFHAGSFDAPRARKHRLLVVDDESIIRMVFKDLMGKECEVVDVATAEEAIDHLRHGPFDLIVTDKNLPGLSGLDLAQEARRLNSESKVILMTGYPSLVTAQQALELGVLDYLLKPFDEIREVRDKIRAALSGAATHRPKASGRRVDVYEDNPATSRQVAEALALLGLEANILTEVKPGGSEPPVAIVVSWDFTPAHGHDAVELGRKLGAGVPFVVLAEHLTMDTALESLRGGAVACLPKLLSDTRALSRELSRALKLSAP